MATLAAFGFALMHLPKCTACVPRLGVEKICATSFYRSCFGVLGKVRSPQPLFSQPRHPQDTASTAPSRVYGVVPQALKCPAPRISVSIASTALVCWRQGAEKPIINAPRAHSKSSVHWAVLVPYCRLFVYCICPYVCDSVTLIRL